MLLLCGPQWISKALNGLLNVDEPFTGPQNRLLHLPRPDLSYSILFPGVFLLHVLYPNIH